MKISKIHRYPELDFGRWIIFHSRDTISFKAKIVLNRYNSYCIIILVEDSIVNMWTFLWKKIFFPYQQATSSFIILRVELQMCSCCCSCWATHQKMANTEVGYRLLWLESRIKVIADVNGYQYRLSR